MAFNKNPIVLQTPEMFAPFGMQKWDNDKYSIDLSFKGLEGRDSLKMFYDKMSELDEKLIDDGVANSFEWLKKKGASREVVKALYTRLVRHPVDKNTGEISTKYPPTFKLTLPWKNGAFQCEVFDSNRNLVDLSTVETKGSRIVAIIQCLGIWVAAGKYGCTWKVLQMRVAPPQKIKGYAFKETENDLIEDEEVDDDHKDVDVDEVLDHAPVESKANHDDDDDSVVDSSSEDELEVKKPEPVKAKKGASKK
jgi:hypothetical protein